MSTNQDEDNGGHDNQTAEGANQDKPYDLPRTSEIPPNPKISLYFTGLMLMTYNGGDEYKRVEVGVHNRAANHTLKIHVKKISSTADPLLELQFDHSRPWNNEIYFQVEGKPEEGGGQARERVEFYQNDPFDRDSLSQEFGQDDFGELSIDDLRDFRWMVDFENRELHGKPVKIMNPASLYPRIYIKDGLFHTARRTRRTFTKILQSVNEESYYGALAHVVGANVYFKKGQRGVLRWGDSDEMKLTFPFEPGTSYKIAFVNGPEEYTKPHNDFINYYDVLTAGGERYNLRAFSEKRNSGLQSDPDRRGGEQLRGSGEDEISRGGTGDGGETRGAEILRGGSDIVPCAPGFLSRTGELPVQS